MDVDFERRIRDAAPPTPPLPGIAGYRAEILTQARNRRGRRVGIWGASAAASLVLIGGGSVAIAGGEHSTPWGWFADNSLTIERSVGADCFVGIRVQWDGVAEDDPMVLDAQRILSEIDLNTLDITTELRDDRAQNASVPEAERLTDDEVRLSAMARVASWHTLDELVVLGYDMRPGHEVFISAEATSCR